MKASIHDAGILRALGPIEVTAYRRSRGWRQTERLGDSGTVWTSTAPAGEEYEILVPLNREVRDYVPRMAEVLQTLETSESRPQPEILRDITTTTADVVRVRLQRGAVEDGT